MIFLRSNYEIVRNIIAFSVVVMYCCFKWVDLSQVLRWYKPMIDQENILLGNPRCHIFETTFFEKLFLEFKYELLQRYTRGTDKFPNVIATNNFFVPIFCASHYTFCVDMIKHTISYYNSLEGGGLILLDIMLRWLQMEHFTKQVEFNLGLTPISLDPNQIRLVS